MQKRCRSGAGLVYLPSLLYHLYLVSMLLAWCPISSYIFNVFIFVSEIFGLSIQCEVRIVFKHGVVANLQIWKETLNDIKYNSAPQHKLSGSDLVT